jgi:hypothetical protein
MWDETGTGTSWRDSAEAHTPEGAGHDERRRFERISMTLPARYLTPDGEEVECETINVSPGGVLFRGGRPPLGANIIAYVSGLGRVQGVAVRLMANGFAIAIAGATAKTERLIHKIEWLKRRGRADQRLFQRVELEGALIALKCADGRQQTVELHDASTMGASFQCDLGLRMGEAVEIAGRKAIVARLLEGGAAVKFR